MCYEVMESMPFLLLSSLCILLNYLIAALILTEMLI